MTCSIERCRAFRGPPIVSCWRGSLCGAAYGGCESLYGSLGAYQGLKPGNWKGYTSLRPVLCGRSSPPRQIPSTRAPNTSDVRTTLSVCVESAVRAATAVLGAPPALSSSTALRKYHGGDTEDGRDKECSKHDFISVWSWSVTSPGCRAPSCRPAVTEVLEKIGPARPARPTYGLIALLEAVEAAIIGRGVVEGAPGPVGMGARSGAADQEQQCETADQPIHGASCWRPLRPRPAYHLADRRLDCRYSNAKMRRQSFFMLITVQPFFFASSYSAGGKVPTLVSGRPCAGP
jgi:hypothetical protein